jgi:DNA end-binding protein Ku
MASSLIDSMAGSFKADEFTDNYRAALQEVIDAKVEGREVVQPEEAEEAPAAAIDLMAALKASVERAKKARGEEPAPKKKATPAKKTAPAKKAAPAKKTAPATKAVKKSA